MKSCYVFVHIDTILLCFVSGYLCVVLLKLLSEFLASKGGK